MPEAAIFRRFASLNIQNLLYYQAELTILERQLQEYELEGPQLQASVPDKIHTTISQCAIDWRWLGLQQPQNPQWQCMLKIREILEKYSPVFVSWDCGAQLTVSLRRCRDYPAVTDFCRSRSQIARSAAPSHLSPAPDRQLSSESPDGSRCTHMGRSEFTQ